MSRLTLAWDITSAGLLKSLLSILLGRWHLLLTSSTEEHVGDPMTNHRSGHCSTHGRGSLCQETWRSLACLSYAGC